MLNFIFSKKKTQKNSVDPDKVPQNAVYDKSLHCLSLIQLV